MISRNILYQVTGYSIIVVIKYIYEVVSKERIT